MQGQALQGRLHFGVLSIEPHTQTMGEKIAYFGDARQGSVDVLLDYAEHVSYVDFSGRIAKCSVWGENLSEHVPVCPESAFDGQSQTLIQHRASNESSHALRFGKLKLRYCRLLVMSEYAP
jgi:hypothetical protein